jgi:TPR repeat protein
MVFLWHYHKAAEQGDADAQNSLGKLYERGLGAAKNLEKAKHLYRQTA